MGVGGQHYSPAALPPGKTRYPLYRRLGGPRGRSGRVRKISPSPGFDPRTVQPVASRYTDWANPAPALKCRHQHSRNVYTYTPRSILHVTADANSKPHTFTCIGPTACCKVRRHSPRNGRFGDRTPVRANLYRFSPDLLRGPRNLL